MNPPHLPELGHLLVVDDDPSSRLFLRATLEKRGFAVTTAESVAQAQARLQTGGIGAFDGVVTDYQMPGLTGLDLLLWLHEQDEGLAAVVVTAESEKRFVTDSLRGGACDFLEKPVSAAQLFAAANRAVTLTRQRRQLVETRAAAQEVGRLQLSLLDAGTHSQALPVDLFFHPKTEAGGDFFNRFRVGTDQEIVLLADVSGHDLKAAFVSAYFQGLLRGMLERGTPATEVFRFFNSFLLNEWSAAVSGRRSAAAVATSVTACAVMIDRAANTATVLTSGAPLPLWVDAEGLAGFVGEAGSFPLGWFPHDSVRSATQPLAPGGAFWLWSDGLEAFADQHELGSATAASALMLAHHRLRPAADLSAALDDILVARVGLASDAPRAEDFFPLVVEEYHGGQARSIDSLQEQWRRSLEFCLPQLSEEVSYNVLLCSREAVINALQHGCAGRADRTARFQISYHPAQKLIRAQVHDPGPGHRFDLARHEVAAYEQLIDAHRGLMIMHCMAARVVSARNGASLIMDFALTPETAASPVNTVTKI